MICAIMDNIFSLLVKISFLIAGLFSVAASSSYASTFSSPVPKAKPANPPAAVISLWEQTKKSIKIDDFERYSQVRKALLADGWQPDLNKSNTRVDNEGNFYESSRSCDFTDNVKKERNSNLGNINTNSKQSVSDKPKNVFDDDNEPVMATVEQDPKAPDEWVMDECLFPETRSCNLGEGNLERISSFQCTFEWLRKVSGSMPVVQSLYIYATKLYVSPWNHNKKRLNSAHPCKWGIIGMYDEGTSDVCVTNVKLALRYGDYPNKGFVSQYLVDTYLKLNPNKKISPYN